MTRGGTRGPSASTSTTLSSTTSTSGPRGNQDLCFLFGTPAQQQTKLVEKAIGVETEIEKADLERHLRFKNNLPVEINL